MTPTERSEYRVLEKTCVYCGTKAMQPYHAPTTTDDQLKELVRDFMESDPGCCVRMPGN